MNKNINNIMDSIGSLFGSADNLPWRDVTLSLTVSMNLLEKEMVFQKVQVTLRT